MLVDPLGYGCKSKHFYFCQAILKVKIRTLTLTNKTNFKFVFLPS